jgi:hypothetical protein
MSNQTDSQNGNRPAELDILDFEDDESRPDFADLAPETEIIGDEPLNDEENDPVMPGDDPTNDDLSPETLINEDGSRSPHEQGGARPTDQDLTIVKEDEIGGGYGLDEAELARAKPLDGKPWNENFTKGN